MTRAFRLLAVAPVLLLSSVLIAIGADAAGRGPISPPTITVVDVAEITLDGNPAVQVTLEAVDPDGIITEMDAYWDDGSIDFAHGYPCLLGPAPAEPGTPHTMILTHTYGEPGTYQPEFEALSLTGCDAPPEEDFEFSEHISLEVVWTHGGSTTTSTTTDPPSGAGSTTTTQPPAEPPPAPVVNRPPTFTG